MPEMRLVIAIHFRECGGMALWGAFHAGGKRDMQVIDGNPNQHKYVVTLGYNSLAVLY